MLDGKRRLRIRNRLGKEALELEDHMHLLSSSVCYSTHSFDCYTIDAGSQRKGLSEVRVSGRRPSRG